MKVNMIKNAGGLFSPADEEAEQQLLALKNCDHYSVEIKLNHNYRLHKKIFAFFKFCTQNYYGDIEVTNDQVDFTRKKITISAGYVKQVFYPDGVSFELVPLSISYASMKPEDRQVYYRKIVNSAMKNIFHSADENTFNQLMNYF